MLKEHSGLRNVPKVVRVPPYIIFSKNLLTQSAAIAATPLPFIPPAGLYVVHYYLLVTVLDAAAGTIQFQVNYTDDLGATSRADTAVALTATSRTHRGTLEIQVASGEVSYQGVLTGIVGNSRYSLYMRFVAMG